ncbi:MAG: tyrosine-type recombinase/integrase [Anaerolineales bacterium]|nr:tyrosine-type recombinase/integrase [Anaerolineales bacterium]
MPSANAALQTQVSTDTLHHIERELLRDPRLQSANSRRGYLADLRSFETWRGARPLTKLLVEEYAAHLLGLSRSPNSINRGLAAVRWWARRVADLAYEGELPRAQRDEIVTQAARVAAIEDVSGERAPKGRHIAQDELQALLRACLADETPAGVRDAAVITLAWSTGLRRSEIAGLRLESWKRQSLGQPIEVIGKGNKRRAVYLHADAVPWLSKWLAVRGSSAGPLFCPVRKGGHVAPNKGISDEALAQMLTKRQLQAALEQAVTWHDFRRTFAGNLLDRGVDLVTVQKLLGHSSPTTTSNYDRRGEETKQRAIQSLQLPLWPTAA